MLSANHLLLNKQMFITLTPVMQEGLSPIDYAESGDKIKMLQIRGAQFVSVSKAWHYAIEKVSIL